MKNRKIKIEGSKFVKYKKEYDQYAADPETILAELRDWAKELCGEDFTFADIYYEFYRHSQRFTSRWILSKGLGHGKNRQML